MDNRKVDDSRWVDDRLAALDAGSAWSPDAQRALERLHQRDRGRRVRRRFWIGAAAAAGVAAGVLLILQAPAACATPQACARSLWEAAFPGRAATAPQTSAASPAFKLSGSPTAPVTVEIYTDYECPACAELYANTIPMLVADYVQTGKIRLLHRDFPLPMHPYSRLAARYANAAGMAGQYDLAVNRIFATQSVWGRNGDVDTQLAQVLPPDVMRKVRDLVANDSHLDDSVAADLAMGAKDHLTQTPTLVIVAGGKRQTIAGAPPYSLLKSYLDQVLGQ